APVARRPFRIDVGRIDHVEARFDERIEQLEAAPLVGRPAEDVAAEDERRHREARAAERALLHAGGRLRGSVKMMRAPFARPFSAWIEPPCASTIARTIASP